MNPYFDMSSDARRAICDAAMARYCPRGIEAPVKVATIMDKTPRQHYEDYCRYIEEFGLEAVSFEAWLYNNRNAPDVKGRDPRIGEVVQVPYFTRATIVAREKWQSGDMYKLQATIGKELMTTYRPCGAI